MTYSFGIPHPEQLQLLLLRNDGTRVMVASFWNVTGMIRLSQSSTYASGPTMMRCLSFRIPAMMMRAALSAEVRAMNLSKKSAASSLAAEGICDL